MKKYQENINYKGQWRFITIPGLKKMPQELVAFLRSKPKEYDTKKLEQEIKERFGFNAKVKYYTNVVTLVGRQQINKALAGELTDIAEIKINYEELGTGTTAPAAGDTGLENPTASTRQPISSVASSSNKLNINSFWAAGNATGTWKEYGNFINGTSTSNSGTMFVHVGIDITVGAADSLVIDGTITLTN